MKIAVPTDTPISSKGNAQRAKRTMGIAIAAIYRNC